MIKIFFLAGLVLTATCTMSQVANAKKTGHQFAGIKSENAFLGNDVIVETPVAEITAEDILKKAVEAYGGEKALAAITDIQLNGTVDVMGQSLDYNQKNVFPNGFATSVSMAGTPVMKQLKKDTTYEMQMPGGAAMGDMDAAAKEEIDTRAAFFTERYMLANPNYKYRLMGKELVSGKEAYVVIILSPKGSESTVYYDVESGLKVQEKRESANPMGGQINITSSYTEYKAFDGIKVATKITIDLGQFSQAIVINDVKVNQGLKMSDL